MAEEVAIYLGFSNGEKSPDEFMPFVKNHKRVRIENDMYYVEVKFNN